MKPEFFIAQRLTDASAGKVSLSRPFVRISTVAVALSLSVMIIAVGVMVGFKKEITEKTIGFGSHIQMVNYDSNISFETHPIPSTLEFLPDIQSIKGVRHIQTFALKPGIIKTDTEIQGVVLKGVSNDFDWSFFEKNLWDGTILALSDSTASNGAMISKTIAQLLKLQVDDTFDMFFVQEPPRVRRFTVTGIYDSQMAEFDKLFVIGDIRHIQRLNGWAPNQITGFELLIDDFKKIYEVTDEVELITLSHFLDDGSRLKVLNIMQKYPQIFDWLGLQDLNVIVLLVLVLAVAGINMISGLLIIILERTNMIGLLKALGAENRLIRNIFLIQSGHIIAKGLFWGNLIGLTVAFLQIHFGLIKLDPENYFLSTVPIDINLLHIILLNIGTFLLTLMMLLVPSMVIAKISPDKTIKFE
ncbi:MAG: FtsX-like permease family protein [Tenuifilaceae bacterium]|nr:FtsX-like permease family protein [Bacteroidales bacterium]MDI9516930.1 FtsX-like permease family protein [Bacteroidota bacterium]NLH56808.1 ABC transporter permease [Rikenellaceae bacterium]OQC63139.1 MAG: Lipoprotein-releasing system transmembrane protein LolE [Bacteroidetes bacterium ADurb.Bin008]HNV81241.1 FtsX-like permease family protein [Tenuifilaceae bacterium]